MTRPTRFGVTLPQIKRSWAEASTAARAFDELGFDSVWVCDHLFGVPNPATPIFEAWSELAAVAAITQHVELGTLVTPPYFRNPAILAKQIATIDQISGGRCIAGLGAGWYEAEFKAYGCDYPPLAERMRALEDMAEILRRMWSEERASYEGPSAVIREAICEPKPARRPPILIGGGGERVLMGIVARHADIWNNMGIFQAQLGAKVEALERRCDQEGRDFSSLEISQQCLVVIAEDESSAKAALEKAERIYGGHMGGGLAEHGIWGAPERVIDCIERHRKLGCSHFIIEFFGRDSTVPARLFADKVMPAFRT